MSLAIVILLRKKACLMAEYFYQRKDLLLNFHQTKPWNIGQPRTLNVDGYHVQARYVVAPRWTVCLHLDVAGHLQEAIRNAARTFCSLPHASRTCPRQNSRVEGISRRTALLDWQLDDRRSLRLQLSRTQSPVALDGNGRMETVNQAVPPRSWHTVVRSSPFGLTPRPTKVGDTMPAHFAGECS
jgi:hypothetical protein